MSVRSLNKIASERDEKAITKAAAKTGDPEAKAKEKELKAEAKGYTDFLVASIPTEPLALYTFLVAGIISTLDAGGDQRLTMRWIIFGVTAGFMILWILASFLRQPKDEKERVLPWVELPAAVVAFAAWGLVMPESPLMATLDGSDRTVWTFIITAAGVALLGLLTGSMKKDVKEKDAD